MDVYDLENWMTQLTIGNCKKTNSVKKGFLNNLGWLRSQWIIFCKARTKSGPGSSNSTSQSCTSAASRAKSFSPLPYSSEWIDQPTNNCESWRVTFDKLICFLKLYFPLNVKNFGINFPITDKVIIIMDASFNAHIETYERFKCNWRLMEAWWWSTLLNTIHYI